MSSHDREAGGDREVTGPESEAPSSGLWGARFSEGLAPDMVPLNRSLGADRRLWRQDVRGSRVWARALAGAGVITDQEAEALDRGLAAVAERLERDFPESAPDEDIHSLVERLLYEEAGAVAGKLHTGRSRNDQAATDFRLWALEAVDRLAARQTRLCRALLDLADRSVDLVMPGYTHLQQAQPIRAAHWVLSHFWALLRDRDRTSGLIDEVGVLPLGSGALAGCPFDVDRELLRAELGFVRLSENSLDAVGDRDWTASLTFAGALMGVHLSRLAEDMVLFSSKEMGFLRLPEGFSTGSSLMPQKRNPDVAELARGKAGRLVGNATTILTLLKGLPTGYNRDLQEDKEAVFDTVDTLELVLPAMSGAVAGSEFRPERIAAALDAGLLATDLADHLVRAGVPFRETHEVVGLLVRRAEEEGCSIEELPDIAFREAHDAFREDFRKVFDWEASVEARRVPGGTSRAAVEAQISEGRDRLG